MPDPWEQAAKPNVLHNVLVVDDEADLTQSICDYLSKSIPGIECLGATSGEKALELLAKERIDLIIADYKMPGMDGLTLLREARRQRGDLACVLITAYPDVDLAIKAVNEAHVSAFVTKPLRPTSFTAAIEEILRAHREADVLASDVGRTLDLAHRRLTEADAALTDARKAVALALDQVHEHSG